MTFPPQRLAPHLTFAAALCLAPGVGCERASDLPAGAATSAAVPVAVTPDEPRDDGGPAGGVAVVELFTSEGCSSCPPADAVVAALADRAEADGTRIFPLALHVDYWDRLGWQDRFAAPAHTRRQRDYARAFGEDRVYTPQAVVNGTAGTVGSRRADVRRLIDAALAEPAAASVTLSVDRDGRSVRVTHAVRWADDPQGHAVVHVVLAQRTAETDVRRGENAGRTLPHAMVVRGWKTVPAAATDPIALTLPDDLPAADARVVAFVQRRDKNRAPGPVLGAASVTVGEVHRPDPPHEQPTTDGDATGSITPPPTGGKSPHGVWGGTGLHDAGELIVGDDY